MVQLINLGGVKSVNGKTVLNGSNSGIDTASLVESLAAARAKPATTLQTKITSNTAKIAAYSQMQTLMSNLQTSLNALRNPGGLDAGANVFAARTPFLTMTDGSTASNYVGVTTANGAPVGKYSIAVNKLATAESMQSSSFAGATAPAVGGSNPLQAGSFKINGSTITLTANENLTNIASAINAVSGQSKVTASIVKLSSGDSRLVLTGKDTGAANTINITDDTTGIGSALTIKQLAQDAEIKFNGDIITRPTNSIDDLLTGVTFTLYQPTPADNSTVPATNTATAILDIDKDDTTIATAIGSFVDAYNALRTFQATQTQRDPNSGALVSTAILGNDPTLSTVLNKLASVINPQTSESIPDASGGDPTGAPTRLGDLGISLTIQPAGATTTAADGTIIPGTPQITNLLSVDTIKLGAKLDSDFDSVEDIFQFNFNSSSSDLSVYKRDNTVVNSNFSIHVDTSQPAGQQAQLVNIDGSALATPVYLDYTVTNGQAVISGPANSSISDLSFLYSGNGNETITKQQNLSSKDMTIAVDGTQPTGHQADITALFGYQLAAPVALNYTATSASALIQGATGGPYAGLQMIYVGSTAQNITVSMSQGIADNVYNSLDGMIKGSGKNDGLIAAATSTLTASDTQMLTQITRINEQVATYRTQLLTKFANLESAIGSANQLLTLLGAQSDARNNS